MRCLYGVLAASLVVPTVAMAQENQPFAISVVEHALGASPVQMMTGHGRLTAGITRDGDIAVLTWPSPSCCDQLTHLASNAVNARTLPRVGVAEGLGVALGLAVVPAPGMPEQVVWFHDPGTFTAQPGYVDGTSLDPEVHFHAASLGLDVDLRDIVSPTDDVLQRVVTVTRAPGSTVVSVALLTHANLGLTQNVVPRLPFGDVLADNRNDYGLVWDATLGAFVAWRPQTAAPVTDLLTLVTPASLPADFFGPLDALMQTSGPLDAQAATVAQGLYTANVPGVYAVVSTDPAPAGYEAGREDSRFCTALGQLVDNVLALGRSGIALPIDPTVAMTFRCPDAVLPANVAMARGWTRVIPTAWDDAQDGMLSGNPVSAYLNDLALRTSVPLNSAGGGSARILIAFGGTATAARDVFTRARTATPDALTAADAADWATRVATLATPDHPGTTYTADDQARILVAARRAILHVEAGTDAVTGSIVASIARQAPYGLDWPRDGSFFDYAMDVSGNPGATTRRLQWALPLARTSPVTSAQINPFVDPAPPLDPRNGNRQYPEAAWEMNYYNTGAMGGFYRFEIDNTALMIWSASVHLGFVSDADRATLAAAWWPTIRRSADLLAAWRDPVTGLQAPANEDDNAAFTQTLHGGTAVYSALVAAARVARYINSPADAQRYERRASELRDALIARFYDPVGGRFVNTVTGPASVNPGSSALGPTAWLVWPARMLPYTDPRVAAQVRSDLQTVLGILRGDPGTQGGAYLTKTTLAAAAFLAGGGDPSVRPLVEEAMVPLARDVIDPNTQVMGEVFVTLRDADGGVIGRENRVSIPHLWEGTLFYLTAMALSDPTVFDYAQHALPDAEVPPPGTVPLPTADGGVSDGGTLPDATAVDSGGIDAGHAPAATPSSCGCAVPGGPPRRGALTFVTLAGVVLARRRRRAA